MRCRRICAVLVAMTVLALSAPATAAGKPLKVFILAGQSNMQGHASVSTFDSLADDPKTAPLLKEMRGPDGKPKVCEKVWISSVGCLGDAYSDLREKKGKLTAGFGAPDDKIGPEFTFGLSAEKLLGEPILIIKTSWGGRSLHTDFRPPSAGPKVFNDFTRDQWKKRGLDADQEAAKNNKNDGVFYRHMIDHVQKVLKDIKRVVPDYDPKQGYELAGFVWFQGFNDLVDRWTYPDQMKPGGYDQYAEFLAHLVRDVRKDLSAPKMPFVIGVMGIGGEKGGREGAQRHFRQAQAAPAALPEFKGNVRVVETAPFWDDDLDALQQRMDKFNDKFENEAKKAAKPTREEKDAARKSAVAEAFTPDELKRFKAGVSNRGYHYLGAAKILAPIGKAFAEALVGLGAADEQYGARRTNFAIGNHKGFVLQPAKPAEGERRWVWYAPTVGDYPNKSNEWVLRQLLDSGIFVAGVDVGESYGNPAGRKVFSEFHQYMVREYQLETKACLLAQSRGGLMMYNWAAENPDKVRCIVGIYPVCDLRSYPGLKVAAEAYAMTPAVLEKQLAQHNPIDRLEPLAKSGVRILHIHGDSDAVVPVEKNSRVVLERYTALGGTMELILVPGKGHAEIPEYFHERKLVEFLKGSSP